MPNWNTQKGITVPEATPTGVAGAYLKENFVNLRNQAVYYTTGTPDASNDVTQGFAIGSRWFDTEAGTMWVCVDASTAAAQWRSVFQRMPGQSADGPLVLCPGNPSSAGSDGGLQLGTGGDPRGEGAIDLQSARNDDVQVATGDRSVIGGGSNNTANGDFSSVLGGQRAQSRLWGQVAHASGAFQNDGDAQHSIYNARLQTTNNTPSIVFLDGASRRLTIPLESTWCFVVKVSGYNTTGNLSAAYHFVGAIKRNHANATTLVGTPTKQVFEDAGMEDCDAEVTADDTNEALQITVTGLNSATIKWHVVVDVSEVCDSDPGFTPWKVANAGALYFNARHGIAVSDGQNIPVWLPTRPFGASSILNGNTGTQPNFDADGLANKPAVIYASGDILTGGVNDFPSLNFIAGMPFFIFVICRFSASTGAHGGFGYWDDTSLATKWGWSWGSVNNANGATQFSWCDQAATHRGKFHNATSVDNREECHIIVYNGDTTLGATSLQVFVNGGSAVNGGGFNTNLSGMTAPTNPKFFIGRSAINNNNFVGGIQEILVSPGALSSNNRNKLFEYAQQQGVF